MSSNNTANKPYMAVKVFDGYNDVGVYAESKPLDKGLAGLMIIASTKYNMDILKLVKKLKKQGLI